jgi:methylated-DNA-[protein]-cysteine S-methyltransferase
MTSSSLTTRCYDSTFGPLTIVGSANGVRAILWPEDNAVRAGLADVQLHEGTVAVLDEAANQLDQYFAGTRSSFDLSLDLQGTTFQLAAWQALAEIPYGETRSYAEQAARLGRPAAVRAVGTANGRNPLSIVLPCHRVVGASGSLTGYAGGLERKEQLLRLEGAML